MSELRDKILFKLADYLLSGLERLLHFIARTE